MIRFGRDICTDFDRATGKEWLETNGLGGFASSTIVGANTRRYHGLLTVQTSGGRRVLLSKLEETLILGGARYELSCNRYPDVVHPEGYRYLEDFRLDPFPIFTYRAGGVCLEKRVCMAYGRNVTVVSYALLDAPRDLVLELRPLLACRDYHGVSKQNSYFNADTEIGDGLLRMTPYDEASGVSLAFGRGEFEPGAFWYYNFMYPRETDRGLEDREDLFSPGTFRYVLRKGESCALVASAGSSEAAGPGDVWESEVRRRAGLVGGWEGRDPFAVALARATDAFLIRRGDGLYTVTAGYHWFTDWGRDTMISLPGLALVTGRHEVAREVLRTFARYCDRGMIPNRFPDVGDAPEYNAVDATLWFVYAVYKYREYTGDLDFVRTLFDVLTAIVDGYAEGTRYGIRMDDDGLLCAGEEGVQLTWMDAKVGDWVVTPRRGKAVEINGLWYNALCVTASLAEEFEYGERAASCRTMADRTAAAFEDRFWNEERGCLYDCLDGDRHDASVRPNQILALSLPYPLLAGDRARAVLDVVRRELLTPFGLRTLSPEDPNYTGHYGGDPVARDAAYHQGTVWPWLLGPFITAWVRLGGSREEARSLLRPLEDHLKEAGLGTFSEIFEGDPPYAPKGCIAQAWSVAEILRAYVEDIEGGPR